MLAMASRGLAILALALSWVGCSSGSNTCSTLPISSKDTYIIIKKEASGNSWCVGLLGFPVIMAPDLYTALQDAKESNGADGLINVSVSSVVHMYLPPFTVNEIEINGDAIKFTRSSTKK